MSLIMKKQNQIILLCLLIASMIITSLHYIDNAIFLDKYPSPEWISSAYGVYIAWIILTLIGLIGYWLYKSGTIGFAYLCLGIYSLTGLSSPVHYFYGAMVEFSLKMHTLIWFDFFAGSLILGFIIWSGLIIREWNL
jgi:hypothetical protein